MLADVFLKPRSNHAIPCVQSPENKNYPKANHLHSESKFMRAGTLLYPQDGE